MNQRDLVTFEVDDERAARMAAAIPDGVLKVAESGVALAAKPPGAWPTPATTPSSSARHLVTASDPAAAVAALTHPSV